MQRHGVPVSTIHLLFVCRADVVVISRALGGLLVVKGKYGVYSVFRAINNERIADPGDINYAMRADTPGFQTPSDNASCRALMMLSHDATGGHTCRYASSLQWLTSDEEQRCTLSYHGVRACIHDVVKESTSDSGGDFRAILVSRL